MYLSRRRDGMSIMMSKTDLIDRALGNAVKTSVREDVVVLIMEERAAKDPGVYIEREVEVSAAHERRPILARVDGWKIEWLL